MDENIANPRVTHYYPGNTYEIGSNKCFTPFDAVDIAHYQDNTGNKQMSYTGDIGDIANALDEVEKQGKRNLTHLFISPPTKSQQLLVKQASQPEIEKGYASSLDNPVMQKQMSNIFEKGYASSLENPALQPAIEKEYASSLDNPVMQKQMSNIVKKTNEKEELRKSFGSTLDHPVFEARFNKMFDDNSKEMEKKYLSPHEQSK